MCHKVIQKEVGYKKKQKLNWSVEVQWKVHISDTYLSSYVLLLLNKHIPFCQENSSSFCISLTSIMRGLRVALPQSGTILHTSRLFCPSKWVQNLGCQVFLHLFHGALSAMIQPSADELRFAWNLPHDLYYLLFSFLKINRIWGKVLGSELCSRTTDATNITLLVTVCGSLSLRLSSSTELHLPITFGVCRRAVSPWSAVREAEFHSFCASSQSPWLTGFLRCVHLTAMACCQLNSPPPRPRFRCLSCAPCQACQGMGKHGLQWGSAAQRRMEQHKVWQWPCFHSWTPQYVLLPFTPW